MISWSQRWLEITGWAKKQFWLKREFVHTGGSDVFRLLPITLNKDGVVDATLLDLSDYALLPGRAGGQHLRGGTGSGETLTLRGSAHATSGGVVVHDSLLARDNAADAVFTGPGQVALKRSTSAPFFSFHNAAGDRIGFFQASESNAFRVWCEISMPMAFATNAIERMQIAANGNIGLGTDSPQARLHAALEAGGGFATKSVSGVAGTAVVLLPAGTVTGKAQVSGIVVASDGSRSSFAIANTAGSNNMLEPGSGNQAIYNDVSPTPAHTCSLRVTAGGALEVLRTLGNRTYSVAIQMTYI